MSSSKIQARSIDTSADIAKESSIQEVGTKVDNLSARLDALAGGVVEYSTPGTYSFTVPQNILAIHVTACGGGGGGAGASYSDSKTHSGSDGGNTIVGNLITLAGGKGATHVASSAAVTLSPGESGGSGGGKGGNYSNVSSSTGSTAANAGENGIKGVGGAGGTELNDGWSSAGGGGGGSLGNGGKGGNGNLTDSTTENGANGTKGGGGGGGGYRQGSQYRSGYAGCGGGGAEAILDEKFIVSSGQVIQITVGSGGNGGTGGSETGSYPWTGRNGGRGGDGYVCISYGLAAL